VHYAILANPCAGRLPIDRKRILLSRAATHLNASVHGLDITTRTDFMRCARELTSRCDVLVVAGGDGTVSDVINAIDTGCHPIAYLPIGTGNALSYALHMQRSIVDAAQQIRNGSIHAYDLISIDGRARAFMTSVGIDSTILKQIKQRCSTGHTGLPAYFLAAWTAYFRAYQRPRASIKTDHAQLEVPNLLSLMVLKQPYYGFGMRVMPEACFDDALLHLRCIEAKLFSLLFSGFAAFTIGNRAGRYLAAQQVTVRVDRSVALQIDGNIGWQADRFRFTVLPQALKIKF